MRKSVFLVSLLLAAVLILASVPLALADSVAGHWQGQWKCVPPPKCDVAGGGMNGDLKQNGAAVTGHFNLLGTVIGNIGGPVNGTISGNLLRGSINASGHHIDMSGTVSGNTINGHFNSSEMGKGTFTIHK